MRTKSGEELEQDYAEMWVIKEVNLGPDWQLRRNPTVIKRLLEKHKET